MLLEQNVTVIWNSRNKKHYMEKGYSFTKMRDKFLVNVKDVTSSYTGIVRIACDYCSETYTVKNNDRKWNLTKAITNKDCCSKCKKSKESESVFSKYGVVNQGQIHSLKGVTRVPEDIVIKAFEDRGYVYVKPQKYNGVKNEHKYKYICPKHVDFGIQQTSYHNLLDGGGCKKCSSERKSGSNSWSWQGGITEINKFLRTSINTWKADTIKEQQGKCMITGKESDIVHHIYGFNLIVKEVFESTGLPIKEIMSDYSDYELELLSTKCLQLHYKYGLGACLAKDVHFLFHETYGYGDNTPEQFNEFTQFYKEEYNAESKSDNRRKDTSKYDESR